MDMWGSIPFEAQIVRGKAPSKMPEYIREIMRDYPGQIEGFIEQLELDSS